MFMEEKQASIWSGKSIEEKQAYGMGCSWKKSKHMERKIHRRKASIWNGMFMDGTQTYG